MPRPNILLITTDQQRFDTIAAAGNPAIFTPHLNWLADTGVRFARCYSDCPVCAPARATIMTGQHAWRHGQTGNDGRASPMARLPTLPGLLTAAGCQTRLIGKAHFEPQRAHYGFEHMELLADYFRWAARQPGAPAPKDHGVGENEMEPVFSTTEERFTQTHWTVDRSIDFIETRDPTRPFFLWTSFAKPHPPFDPLKSYWDLYEGIALPEPWTGDWSATQEAIAAGFCHPTWHLNNVQRFSAEQLRAVRRAYYACITQIDYNLGLLFARLRELKLLEHTWIIFTSDHGEMLGDHHLGAKSVFFEGSAHVPLLIRPPSGHAPKIGRVDDRLTCLADLLPTCLAVAGVEAPTAATLDGIDLLGSSRRAELFGTCNDIHSLITPTHKFHFAARGSDELCFDITTDAAERHDLIRANKQCDVVAAMRQRLARHLAERNHPAARDGNLVSLGPPPSAAEVRRNAWPGFHHRSDASCDLLH